MKSAHVAIRRRAAVSLLLLVLCPFACRAQEILHRYDFSAGPGEWFAANSVAPLEVVDGALTVRVDGFDPYIHSSRRNDLDLRVDPQCYIRVRARSSVAGPVEFFWAEGTEGRDGGFVAGKEIHFSLLGDGEFHTYNVFPGWDGQLTRLRFDPPGGEEEGAVVHIQSVDILRLPAAERSAGPVWEFAGTLAGFVPSRFVSDFAFEPDAVLLTGHGSAPTIAIGDLALQAADLPWLTVEADASDDTILTVQWADEEGDFTAARATARIPAGRTRHTVKLGDRKPWRGTITGLRLFWQATDRPLTLRLRRLAFGKTPVGDPVHEVLSAGVDRAVAFAGEDVGVRARFRNAGDRPLAGPAYRVLDAAGTVLGAWEHDRLGPGEEAEGIVRIRPAAPGPLDLRLSFGPDRPERVVRVLVAHPLPATDPPRGASVTAAEASLVSDTVRLRAPAAGDGTYGPLAVELLRGGAWRRVAVMPVAGGVRTAPGPGAEFTVGKASRILLSRGGLRFAAEAVGEAGTVRSEAEFRLTDDPGRIDMQHELRLPAGVPLYRYDGPLLRVGDGTFGAAKHEALFPGLEYLAAHEVSSSDRDILPPGDLRAVSHPNRICIPLMAVTSPDDDLVALLWDNRQAWVSGHDQPSALFASPNFVESGDPRFAPAAVGPLRSGDNHLMGLFAPSIPEFLPENGLEAETPFRSDRVSRIRLRSTLLVRADGDVLDAASAWMRLYDPVPVGDPPKPMREHRELSLQAMEELLYKPGEGWAPVQNWDPAPSPRTALAYIGLAHDMNRPDLRERALTRTAGVASIPLSLHSGNVIEAIRQTKSGGYRALGRRESDGTWVFRPDEKTKSLGEAGDTNIGMACGSVEQILRAAAIAADPRLLEEGLRGLDWMSQWRVPRGAQVWEIPLHAPDILASAQASAAALWAYRLTADPSRLQDAVYRARTGIPFVYMWQTPEAGREPMRGGTIPIFGATFYVGSWYGRLVQWCGLEYAFALLDLAPYDNTEDWRTLARDIVVSGWRQQAEREGYAGLYPDSWGMLDGVISWGLMLSPDRLVQAQMKLDGVDPDGDVRVFRRGDKLLSLLAPGRLSDVRAGAAGDGRVAADLGTDRFDLEFAHTFALHSEAYLAVVGVDAPVEVRVGADVLPPVARFEDADEGWLHDPEVNCLVLRVNQPAERAVRVTISGLTVHTPPPARTEWTFDTGTEGWTADHDLEPLTVRDGMLVCTPTGGDPFLSTPLADLPATAYDRVLIRCTASAPNPIQVFWAGSGGGYHPDRQMTAAVRGTGTVEDVIVEVGKSPQWRGALYGLRIDPPASGLAIEEVRMLPPGP